jgi:hypothetical protein
MSKSGILPYKMDLPQAYEAKPDLKSPEDAP